MTWTEFNLLAANAEQDPTGHATTPVNDAIPYPHCIKCGHIKPRTGWVSTCRGSWGTLAVRLKVGDDDGI